MKHFKFTRFCASWVFLLTLFSPHFLSGQNFCGCLGNTLSSPQELNPDMDCMTLLDQNDLAASPCSGDFVFYVIDPALGDTIIFDTTSVMVDLKPYVGDILLVSVFDIGSDSTCSSYYRIIDDTTPMIICPSDVVVCTDFPDNVEPVVIVEGCSTVVLSPPSDSIGMPDCSGDQYRKVFRNYTADDGNGNILSCQQEVVILRSDTSEVDFPDNMELGCSDAFDTSVTGLPTLNGVPFVNSLYCNLQLFLQEDIDTLDCGDRLVFRNWQFIDDCNPDITKEATQLIKLVDTIPPVFTFCSPLFTFNADQNCMANPVVPVPNVTDNCNSFTIQAIVNNNINGVLTNQGFMFSGLTEGDYSLKFIATDSCGNVDSCLSSIKIVDVTTPTAVCDGGLVVSLNNNGMAILQADSLNEGSNDACGGPLDFKISRDGVNFSDFVTFNCNDALVDSVLVTLLVIDATNISSTNICMVGVKVRDKIDPVLFCPFPVTIACGASYSPLSQFGQLTIFEACGVDTVESVVIDIDNCGTGTIMRTWVATDSSGNDSDCTQIITVENQTPYNGSSIIWPKDTTFINGCLLPTALEPSDLPSGYDGPTVPDLPCAMIATSYKDQLFSINFPTCYKIVRTWKVMDWCQYNPSNPTVGIWQRQQVIAVMDTEPPIITFCPSDGTFGLNAACTFAEVNLQPLIAEGTCANENFTITNDSPYANSNGANASGNYPEGVHTITFTVKDGCGNKVTCSATITASDLKKPTPFCKDGIIGELQYMPNASPEIMAVVKASQLNYNSFDNCTPAANLVYTMRPVGSALPKTASIVYDCDGEGIHEVEIWVTDAAGNSDFCKTKITIQDNMNLCPDTLTVSNGMIGGGIQTQMGEVFPDVHVDINSMSISYMTDPEGKYEFQNLSVGDSYTVEPWKNDDWKNGVTTYDIVLMARHILGVQTLTDPYQLIAADVNNSGAVTTFDMVGLRKLILGVDQSFPNNKSWRFVQAGYVFPNPNTPSDPPYPEVMNVSSLNTDITNADFVGVKIGDVNGSASVNFNGTNDRDAENLNILLEDRKIEAGEEFTVPFRPERENKLLALQFTLEFETNLELQGIEKGALSGVAGDRFVTSQVRDGIMTGTWYHTSPVLTTTGDALFSLRFTSKKAGMLSDMIELTDRKTETVAYDEREIPLNLNLVFSNPTNMLTNHAFQLHQNQPNPFKRVTNIGFTLPENGPAKLSIFDVSGNLLRTYDRVFEQGYNEVSIMRQELPTGGVLFYQLQTPTHTATKKMILLQ